MVDARRAGRSGSGASVRARHGVGTEATSSGELPDGVELPDPPGEGRISDPEVAAAALVARKPQIGDTRPAPGTKPATPSSSTPGESRATADAKKKRRRPTRSKRGAKPATVTVTDHEHDQPERRRGRERNGRPVGRNMMCVQVRDNLTQVAVLEGRSLIEHYVSRPADDVSQIHGNIYLGQVQNVLPGMEAAFVDIATPKNAVLYRGDVQYDSEDIVERANQPRIEQILKSRQLILCQVTKNPIGAKGARLTQEVSLPGRFVVLIPNSRTYGISKRLPDDERKRLRAHPRPGQARRARARSCAQRRRVPASRSCGPTCSAWSRPGTTSPVVPIRRARPTSRSCSTASRNWRSG